MLRKSIVFVTLFLVSQLNVIKAQDLFSAPDTVCIRQPVHIKSNVVNASSYYWSFCSGYLLAPPVGNNAGPDPDFDVPGAIEVVKDNGNYYGFVINSGTNELLRLEFGNSLSNIPTKTNFGTLNNTVPESSNNIFITKDSNGNWFMFVSGGTTQATSSFARFDFGNSLANNPNSVNFGNLTGVLNAPKGIFVLEEAGNYYGYMVNSIDNKLIYLDFGNNISLTPTVVDLGTGYGFSGASDMLPMFENGEWYAFVINKTNSNLIRLDLGSSLSVPVPVTSSNALGNINNRFNQPSSLSFVRDCGNVHLFVTNSASNDLVRVNMPAGVTGGLLATAFAGVGTMATPSSISRIIREGDNIYAFVTNEGDNSLSQIIFPQCTNASIQSSTLATPPSVVYGTPGLYNIFLAVDEGLPTMQVECHQIRVLDLPPVVLSNDTVICQGDTIALSVYAIFSLPHVWYPDSNITEHDTTAAIIRVSPEYSFTYNVTIPYSNGCIVDTPVRVDVVKNKADAGSDRTLFDGAQTLLGGPLTSEGTDWKYRWFPNQYISDTSHPNPVVNPPFDFTYYLEVTNSFGCYDIDTVVVHVTCNDLNLPNAFVPESKNLETRGFGLMNNQVVKLNYLRVFDRWGKLVFETSDVSKKWDGKYDNGEPAPYGVYVWEADGFCTLGRRFKRSGNVTLIR